MKSRRKLFEHHQQWMNSGDEHYFCLSVIQLYHVGRCAIFYVTFDATLHKEISRLDILSDRVTSLVVSHH